MSLAALQLAATPLVNWRGLLSVVIFAAVAGAVIASAFSLGLVGVARYQQMTGPSGEATTRGLLWFGLAVACFTVCVAAAAWGLWALIAK